MMALFGYLLYQALEIYSFIIIAAIIVSWLIAFNVISTAHPATRQILNILGRLTNPVLRFIQRYVPSIGGIDLSPMIVIFGIMFLQHMVVRVFF